MFDDDIIKELREVREAFARSHRYDVQAMAADLRAEDLASDRPVVRRPARRPNPDLAPVSESDQKSALTKASSSDS
jgi:hypothetical protein